MTKVFMRVSNGRLVPEEDQAKALMAKHANGSELIVDVYQPRDRAFFRRWWKMMDILAEHMPGMVDKESASGMVLIACGEVDWCTDPRDGRMWPVPRSIAIGNMDEDVAQRLWKRAVYYITTEWVPVGSDELQAEIDDFFAGPEGRSLGRRVTEQHSARAA